jgi:outer membrane biosynthesis protein TonB
MEYIREHKRGIIGTIVFHTIVILLLFFVRLFHIIPIPGDEGILVNFGTSENGLGEFEPSPANSEPAAAEPVEVQEATAPPAVAKPKPQPKPAVAKEQIMTQDYEKTAAIKAAENKKKVEEQKRKDLLAEQEKVKKQREEEERIRKAEAEKIARAEAEAKKKAEEQRKINEINSRTQGAFASKGTGSGGKGTGAGTSQGVTFPGGNQGVPTGDPNATAYGQGGLGSGSKGTGTSFSLNGRSATSLPKPNYPGDDEGVVVVKINVDKNGNVTAAEPGAKGTTIMEQQFWAEAKQAAFKAKFNVDNNAPAFQQGTITYRFTMN